VAGAGLTRQAISATTHCLTGCAIGGVLGMVFAFITTMEIVDNAFLLLVPGAMDAGLGRRCSGAAWPCRWRSPS
jgi:hypothetical protein